MQNEDLSEVIKIALISLKLTRQHIRCFGHILRRIVNQLIRLATGFETGD